MSQARDEVIQYFQGRNGYRDKEIAPMPTTPEREGGEKPKVIVVRWRFEDTVKLRRGDGFTSGFVTGIIARPSGVLYEVSWPDNRTTTQHFDFELEDAE